MNIQEAKEEIIRSVRAYTAKDERGACRIPPVRQRPVFLVGPPGIGKTAIMEQAAGECGVGLVAYTITHHTRQSAVGLPQLMKKTFGGREYTVTEYTMSEIIGSVYEYMEQTGRKEGILFIDEINCVSETLAPTMLQFLQYKTFGNHKVPDGWMIVAAGNPPECNRSVRELDMAALDRVRVLEVEAEFAVWKEYALQAMVHPAILSYLELHPEYFYQVILTRDKKEFVTARGWEDLSVLLKEYERQGMPAGRAFMDGLLRVPAIASDFTSYYRLYTAYTGEYRVAELAAESLEKEEEKALLQRLQDAPGDVRCMFVKHLLAAASGRMCSYGGNRRLYGREREVLEQFLSYVKQEGAGQPEAFLERRSRSLQAKKQNGLLKPWEETMEEAVDEWLKGLLFGEARSVFLQEASSGTGMTDSLLAAAGIERMAKKLEEERQGLLGFLGHMTDFLLEAFGKDLELSDWLHGIKSHGDYRFSGFTRPEFTELLDQKEQEKRLRKEIREMEGLYEAADRV